MRRGLEEKRGDPPARDPRRGKPERDGDDRHPDTFAEDHLHDIPDLRTERDANAEFVATLSRAGERDQVALSLRRVQADGWAVDGLWR